MLRWSYLVSCTELIKQSLVDDSKLGEAVRPYVERRMMGKHVHKYNKVKKNLFVIALNGFHLKHQVARS